jgi:hypothetical protein
MLRIRSDIEEIPVLINVVDFKTASEDFKKIATKNIIYL